jgi:tRNA-splicing ligase RtcB
MATGTERIRIFGDADERTVAQLERCLLAEDDSRGVLCADNHLGYSQPIGGAVAYREHISPSGVGYDIGCGNKAVRTNIRASDIVGGVGSAPRGTSAESRSGSVGAPGSAALTRAKNEASAHAYSSGPAQSALARIMDEIVQRVSFGMGRVNNEPADHPVLDAIREANFAPQRELYDLAAKQLGTVGAGNHYVDLFADEDGVLWVGVHFGSRGFGHKTASGFLALAAGKKFGERAGEGEMDSPPIVFPTDSELGQGYIEAMRLAGNYAYAGRDVVVDTVLGILGAEAIEEIHNHHNYAWLEEHDGEDWWVVRKGCTPAFPGQQGFVGATMGEDSVILEGTETGEAAMFSTVHGAGRAMSRTEAAGKVKRRKRWECNDRDCTYSHTDRTQFACPDHPDGKPIKRHVSEQVRPGRIDFGLVTADLRSRGIELRGGAADEAPGAYKRLDKVLAAHGDTITVRHRLRPLGVAMASRDTFDPFKD